jgi:alginate O-acetyltransferase complex protein AlgI
MTELWRRWHISLSEWLRDYLYMPIYIAKRDWGKTAVVFSQMATFAVCGLWHGAGWQFLIYGLIHGFYLVSEYLLKIRSSWFNKNFLKKCIGVFITFNLLSFSLIFFRSPDLAHVASMFGNIFTNLLPLEVIIYDSAFFITMLAMLAVLLFIDYVFFRNNDFDSLYLNRKKSLFALNVTLFMLIVLFGVSSNTQFIYFQF